MSGAWFIVTLSQLSWHQITGRAAEADALPEENGAAQILPTGLGAGIRAKQQWWMSGGMYGGIEVSNIVRNSMTIK